MLNWCLCFSTSFCGLFGRWTQAREFHNVMFWCVCSVLLELSACVFVHQGKSEYLRWISAELETHATVYQSPGQTSSLPSFIRNHGLLSQERFVQLLHRAKVGEKEKCEMESWYQRHSSVPTKKQGEFCLICWLLSCLGVCRPRVPLRGSSSHWGHCFRLRLPSASLPSSALSGQQWFLQREAHHKTGSTLSSEPTSNWETNKNPSQTLGWKITEPVLFADLLPAPVRPNVHRRTACVDCGRRQQEWCSPGARIHPARRRGGELGDFSLPFT